jgi:hypothetical protein
VGREGRLFAAHEDVLALSPVFTAACRSQLVAESKRIDLPDEEPEIFSCVLEYLYVCSSALPFASSSPSLGIHMLISGTTEGRLLPPLATPQAP